MSAGYEKAIKASVPAAQVGRPVPCDPVRGPGDRPGSPRGYNRGRALCHGARHVDQGHALQPAEGSRQPDRSQLATLAEVQQTNKRLYRGYLLLNELRCVYRVPRHQAPEQLDAWLSWASRSKLKPFVKLARTIRKHRAGVLAAIQLGISNGRLEGLDSGSDCSHTAPTASTPPTR